MAPGNVLLQIFITIGVLLAACPSGARRTICLRQPSEVGVSILGGMEAGNFVNLGTAKDINECLQRACNSKEGNIAFLLHKTCFSVKCYSTQSCDLETLDTPGSKTAGALYRIIAAYPVFKNAPKVIKVDEDTPSGTEVFRLKPSAESRKREKETMTFEIEAGNTDRTFRLYPKLSNRRVSILTRKALDREKVASYHLKIKATNRVENVSSILNITINITDINDNHPRFIKSLFVFSVFSNMSVGASLGRVVANDNDTGEDAKLEYTITPESDLITLNPDSGEVKLSKILRVDAVKSFDYQITATDGIHTTESRLRVEVYPNNVNRPTFYKYSYEVQLNGQVPVNTEVVRVDASDPDFGKLGELTYLIRHGDEEGMFWITGNGEIRTASKLSPRQVYNLTIDVRDNGYPELHALKSAYVVIRIQWLRFKQDIYQTAVLEDLRLSQNVFTVSASVWVGDTELMAGQRQRSSSGINYYLDDVIMSLDQFEIEETTGVISLRKSLDYERRKVYELELRADKESADSTPRRTVLTAKAILQIQVLDVNDNAPRFSRLFYSQDVWRSSKVDSPILKINATDADHGDNGLIKFVVISGNFNNTFSFDSDGMMFLRKSLTLTKLTTFNITIAAVDSGQPEPLRSADTALVTIHVRGYTPRAPVFSKTSYKAMVSESIPTETKIIQVKARVYKARSRVTYWVRNSEYKLPFRVDRKTGWIRNTQRLDREKKTSYVLTTVASTDLDRVSLISVVNVTIILDDENDNRPVFTRDSYSAVLTSHKVGSDILQIKATDNDQGANGRIVYKIKGGRDKKYFSINSSTGVITTKSVLPTQSLLLLKCIVSAKDDGTPPMTSSKAVPVYVLIGLTFPIQVTMLKKTTTEMKLRFTMINVTLEDISYIAVVVQEEDKITNYDEITKRPLESWFYIHNAKGNGVFAQRYLTGKVQCTDVIRKTKTFDFTVGSDGKECAKNKKKFCNGQLHAEKMYRLQLVAYFKNGTTPENVTNVESIITSAFVTTKAGNANRSAGFRSWHYDVIVIVLGIIVGLIIIGIITRAIMLYRRDKLRMEKEEAKDGISYPLSNPRYRRSGEHTPSSRSTISFAELSKSRQDNKKLEKVSPNETEKLQIGQDEPGGISRDSGCGVSVKSSNSFINHTRTSSVRRAFFSFGTKNKDDEEEEEASDKEIETELNT